MSLGESPTRTGLQVAFELQRGPFVGKLNDQDGLPGTVIASLPVRSEVVPLQSAFNVGGHTDVVARRIRFATKYIDEALADSHDLERLEDFQGAEVRLRRLARLAAAHATVVLARVSEGWLGGRDSNPDNVVQSHVSYR